MDACHRTDTSDAGRGDMLWRFAFEKLSTSPALCGLQDHNRSSGLRKEFIMNGQKPAWCELLTMQAHNRLVWSSCRIFMKKVSGHGRISRRIDCQC